MVCNGTGLPMIPKCFLEEEMCSTASSSSDIFKKWDGVVKKRDDRLTVGGNKGIISSNKNSSSN
jgi:hypothetical protein